MLASVARLIGFLACCGTMLFYTNQNLANENIIECTNLDDPKCIQAILEQSGSGSGDALLDDKAIDLLQNALYDELIAIQSGVDDAIFGDEGSSSGDSTLDMFSGDDEPSTQPMNAFAQQVVVTVPASPSRIVAIGDIHGDLNAFKTALRLARILSDEDEWIGGETVVVQLGDLIDRGPQDFEVLEFTQYLKIQSSFHGGGFFHVLGNHEIMNTMGFFHYVHPDAFSPFVDRNDDNVIIDKLFSQVPPHARARASSLSPGGMFAFQFAQEKAILTVDDTVFVHGGLLPSHVAYGIENINNEVQMWLEGVMPLTLDSEFFELLTGENSPFWLRLFGTPNPDCETLEKVLDSMGLKRMVIGHSIQSNGVNSVCGDRLWRIDVALSSGIHGGALGKPPVQVLELTPSEAHVLSSSSSSVSLTSH